MNAPLGKADFTGLGIADAPLAASSERRRLRLYIGLMLGDLLSLLAGFALAGFVYTGTFPESRAMMEAQMLLPLYFTIALYNRAYSIRALTSRRDAIALMAAALLVSSALLNFIAFYAKYNAQFSRATFTIGLAMSFALMALLRQSVFAMLERRSGAPLENLMIIRDGGPRVELAGAHLVDAEAFGLAPVTHDPHAFDRLGNCLRHMDRVIVSCQPARRAEWAFVLKCMGVDGQVLSDTAQAMGAVGVRHYEEADISTLVVASGPLGLRDRIAKRLFDVAISAGAILVLAPLLLVLALLVKLDDGGPVLFTQRRLGRANRFFTIYKFRSMSAARADRDGARSASRDDDRVTRIGRLLRATSIDELPQLLNVLKGEMSIVGPRPHALASQAGSKLFWEVDPLYWQRHALKPGLTGLAQVRGHRGETQAEVDLSRRLQSDLEYVHGWSIWRDVGIVVRTLRVLVHERAY
jgi:exopolysaccharide biosynthesis polyprenyl glycosylphosphotransferase